MDKFQGHIQNHTHTKEKLKSRTVTENWPIVSYSLVILCEQFSASASCYKWTFLLSLDPTGEFFTLSDERMMSIRTYNKSVHYFVLSTSYLMFHTPTHTVPFLSAPAFWMKHPDLEISLRNAHKNIFLGNMTHSSV